jgi:suppressor for copper-sensitivity B
MNGKWYFSLLCLAACGWFSTALVAQEPEISGAPKAAQGLGLNADFEENVEVSGKYEFDQKYQQARISVTAKIPEGRHTFSVTQPKGGPKATTIKVTSPDLADPAAIKFSPNQPPHSHVDQDVWKGVTIEEHEGRITWTALAPLAAGVDPEKATISVDVKGQHCSNDLGNCIPFRQQLNLAFGGFIGKRTAGVFQSSDVKLEAHVSPAAVSPGDEVLVRITATPKSGGFMRAWQPQVSDGMKPTLFVLNKSAGLLYEGITASVEPVTESSGAKTSPIYKPDQPVTWTLKLKVPREANKEPKQLEGFFGYQVCDEASCASETAVRFEVTLESGTAPPESKLPLQFSEASYNAASEAAATVKYEQVRPIDWKQMAIMVGFSVLGGLILNLMPCVLPVIGLKILSFAEQGGQSRAQVFALNLWYSAGLILVFLVLATLAAFLNLGWGQQFTYTWFKVAMVGLVFAMALSFLGVWEIPLPGFVGMGHSNQLQQKEGAAGAFFKGIFTTILATPCSGPFLGPVFAFTLSQPWYATYIIFASVGVGMALPYLIIGLSPALVRWLPKPGDWMDTFKQLMGFILLGTVVYLCSIIKTEYFIPTLATMMGVWFGCWCIGRVPAYAESFEKLQGWAVGLVWIAIITTCSFYFLAPWPHLYHWEKYSPAALAQARQEGKTVMIDFTASWCQTCQWNFFSAINSYAVKNVVDKNQVTALLADWSEPSDEIEAKLQELNSRSIPLLAIYPADPQAEAIVLRDTVTQAQVIEALNKAGPSLKPAKDLHQQAAQPKLHENARQ